MLLLLLLLVLLFLLLLLQNDVLVVALLDPRHPDMIRASHVSREKLKRDDQFQAKATHAIACPGNICSANISHAESLIVVACKSMKFGQYGFQSQIRVAFLLVHKQPPLRANLDMSIKNFVRRHCCELWIELFRLVSFLLDAHVYRGVSGLLHMQWIWIILHLLQYQFPMVFLPASHRHTLHQMRCSCCTCKSGPSKSLHL